MNAEYMTVFQYIECKSKIIGKVATYDILIKGLEKNILEATVSGIYSEYELDDGQMKCRTKYRSTGEMIKALHGLRKIRQDYINQYNGRGMVLRGGSL